jgi:hypothetical protein
VRGIGVLLQVPTLRWIPFDVVSETVFVRVVGYSLDHVRARIELKLPQRLSKKLGRYTQRAGPSCDLLHRQLCLCMPYHQPLLSDVKVLPDSEVQPGLGGPIDRRNSTWGLVQTECPVLLASLMV